MKPKILNLNYDNWQSNTFAPIDSITKKKVSLYVTLSKMAVGKVINKLFLVAHKIDRILKNKLIFDFNIQYVILHI